MSKCEQNENKTNHKKKSNNNHSKVSKGQNQDRKMMHDAQTPNNPYTYTPKMGI